MALIRCGSGHNSKDIFFVGRGFANSTHTTINVKDIVYLNNYIQSIASDGTITFKKGAPSTLKIWWFTRYMGRNGGFRYIHYVYNGTDTNLGRSDQISNPISVNLNNLKSGDTLRIYSNDYSGEGDLYSTIGEVNCSINVT